MSRGIDKSIHLRRHVSSRVVQAPIDMRLIPGGTGVLRTLSQEFEGLYIRTLRVDRAVVGIWKRRVTTGIGRSRTMQGRDARSGIELWQTVERLIRIAILSPVLPHRAKVVVERTVLLNHEDDVINLPEPLRSFRGLLG